VHWWARSAWTAKTGCLAPCGPTRFRETKRFQRSQYIQYEGNSFTGSGTAGLNGLNAAQHFLGRAALPMRGFHETWHCTPARTHFAKFNTFTGTLVRTAAGGLCPVSRLAVFKSTAPSGCGPLQNPGQRQRWHGTNDPFTDSKWAEQHAGPSATAAHGSRFRIRNAKENFKSWTSWGCWARVAGCRGRWEYKTKGRTNISGPWRRIFPRHFGLNGEDRTHTSPSGRMEACVAAIQGLNQKLEGRKRECELKARLEKLEQCWAPKLAGE